MLISHVDVRTKIGDRLKPDFDPALALLRYEPKLAFAKTVFHNEMIIHAAANAGRVDIIKMLVSAPYFCDPTARMGTREREIDPKQIAMDRVTSIEEEVAREKLIDLVLDETNEKQIAQIAFEDTLQFLDDMETFDFAIENAMTNGDSISVDESLRQIMRMMKDER
jgi:hypothetical protein